MITEIAMLYIKKGNERQFEIDFSTASKYISSINGYINHKILKCLEESHKYVLIVEWKSLEDHTKGFMTSPQYQKWKELLYHYYEPFPIVEHYKSL